MHFGGGKAKGDQCNSIVTVLEGEGGGGLEGEGEGGGLEGEATS